MQCIRAFIAQQPDELSLEKADVILVHPESTDCKIIKLLTPSLQVCIQVFAGKKNFFMLDSFPSLGRGDQALGSASWMGAQVSSGNHSKLQSQNTQPVGCSQTDSSHGCSLTPEWNIMMTWPHHRGSNSVICTGNCWITDDGHPVTFLEENAAAENDVRLHLGVAVALACVTCWNNVLRAAVVACLKESTNIKIFNCYAQHITNIECTLVDWCFKRSIF